MKRTVVLSATVIVVLLLAAPSYADVLLTGADWQMNETSGQMIDSSGNNNDGDPTDVGQRGSGYDFNGSTSYVLVPDSDSLDPEESDITLSARVKVTDKPMDDDSYDIVRKGLVRPPRRRLQDGDKEGGRPHRRQAALPLQGRRWHGGQSRRGRTSWTGTGISWSA